MNKANCHFVLLLFLYYRSARDYSLCSTIMAFTCSSWKPLTVLVLWCLLWSSTSGHVVAACRRGDTLSRSFLKPFRDLISLFVFGFNAPNERLLILRDV